MRPSAARAACRHLFVSFLRMGLGAGLCLGAHGMAHSASLQISPVTVSLRADEAATALTLSNDGAEPLYGQVRVFRWDQANGEDALQPTQDVVASPPLIQVGPNSHQVIRLLRVKSEPPATEQTYRVLIDEIAPPGAVQESGVTVRLRYSVPVFISPSVNTQAELQWRLWRNEGGWMLEAVNQGTRRAQISAVQLVAGSHVYDLNKGLMGYALAGRARRWQLPLPADAPLGGSLKIRARINSSPVEAAVTASRAP
jgi:fimbrial chaperone protein